MTPRPASSPSGGSPRSAGSPWSLISVVVLCGSVYLILSTNLGSRLGFLVALAGLFGWLMMMGIFWWVYGIGLKGKAPSLGRHGGHRHRAQPSRPRGGPGRRPQSRPRRTKPVDGWNRIAEDDPAFGQTVAAADDILQNQTETFQAGEYEAVAVYEKGGERYPKIGNSLDFLAFRHRPHYAIVEVQPVVPTIAEPGRAPAAGRARHVEAADLRADGARPGHAAPARGVADGRARAWCSRCAATRSTAGSGTLQGQPGGSGSRRVDRRRRAGRDPGLRREARERRGPVPADRHPAGAGRRVRPHELPGVEPARRPSAAARPRKRRTSAASSPAASCPSASRSASTWWRCSSSCSTSRSSSSTRTP